ncbi:helix-turn-helix domain-containing protein [Streptomyces cacaoi]|uniref:helix-turn-helix domain-containing protein n=1 Tax=Streptomyces cacaoi TaxID=1898 RepID=UPI002608B79A|nr:helix-turn-helix transcriptional regulator [Streptomyces cacaoi]
MTAESEAGADFRSNPQVSTLAYFGTELRIKREEAGLSQTSLARQTFCTHSLVSRVESAKRIPTQEFAQRCDEVLGTGGTFLRLWPLVIQHAYPDWFRPFVELEKDAKEIWGFEAQVFPGLLQTEEYARAMFDAGSLPNADELVAARMTRQEIFEKGMPPEVWAIIDENALRRVIGGPQVMRRQLEKLAEAAQDPRITVQVLPLDIGAHAALNGSFTGLSLEEGQDVLYVEGIVRGHVVAEPNDVKAARRAYDLLRADALPPRASVKMIAAMAKELSS